MTDQVVVISDFHLSSHAPDRTGTTCTALSRLLREGCRAGGIVVLAGDTFDFLTIPGRSRCLDLDGAPTLVDAELTMIGGHRWGQVLFRDLAAIVEQGGRLVMIPGNHDPELYHPQVEDIFRKHLGIAPREQNFLIHRENGPWHHRVGEWPVAVGHGCRPDPWNRIEVDNLHDALKTGKATLPLPLGSQLVLDTVNAFKRAQDPLSGKPRFPFVEQLKPEFPGVFLLLFYLDPQLALSHLPGLGGKLAKLGWQELAATFRREFRKMLQGVVLLGEGGQLSVPTGKGPGGVMAEMCTAIVANLTPEELLAKDALIRQVESWLVGAGTATAGTLSNHGGGRPVLRAALRFLATDDKTFDINVMSDQDRRIFSDIATRNSPTLVVAGHTHLARVSHVANQRIYLNSGTWTELMEFPQWESDQQAREWVDLLESGRAETFRKFSYAEITPQGGSLKYWD